MNITVKLTRDSDVLLYFFPRTLTVILFGRAKPLGNFGRGLELGLPGLRNLVNIYTSSNNRNDSIYTELPDLIFFIMQIGKITDFLP